MGFPYYFEKNKIWHHWARPLTFQFFPCPTLQLHYVSEPWRHLNLLIWRMTTSEESFIS